MPVEVIKFAQALVVKKITALGAAVTVRGASSGKPFITDEGNHIRDCNFGQISDPPTLARELEDDFRRGRAWIVYRNGWVGVGGKGDKVVELRAAGA